MDRLLGMRVFVRVVERGSFARAAQDLDLSATQASAHVADLERRLGTKLLNRTTRKVSVTADGRAYYDRAARILRDIEDAENEVSSRQGVLRGTLRVDAPPLFARAVLIPALPAFLGAHPGLTLDLRLRDQLSDLVGEGIDCAIRVAKLADSSLVARRLGGTRLVTLAAPEYLASKPAPRTPEELAGHNCIGFRLAHLGAAAPWLFRRAGERVVIEPKGNLMCDTGEAHLAAAIAGVGVIQTLSIVTMGLVGSGRLVTLLDDWSSAGPPMSLVYAPGKPVPAKIRAFADFVLSVCPSVPT
ncbi:MAG: LysR substrate-binding domain-containing protein [Burkholderiales bacterium]|nr:LysR substrate-binding domain-containing protein [Burkholderiales bacterium]